MTFQVDEGALIPTLMTQLRGKDRRRLKKSRGEKTGGYRGQFIEYILISESNNSMC